MQLPKSSFLALFFTLCVVALPATQAEENRCPTEDYACLDVINSSLCLSQNAARGTKEAMAACVDYPGAMSDLPGAAKLCRCPGCHSASINEAIAKNFPPPCA